MKGFLLLSISVALVAGCALPRDVVSPPSQAKLSTYKNEAKGICSSLKIADHIYDACVLEKFQYLLSVREPSYYEQAFPFGYDKEISAKYYPTTSAINTIVEVYNIDTLRITTKSIDTESCASGGVYEISLDGAIGPDSSFAMEKLLQRSPHCRNARGDVTVATKVLLNSSGGFLLDGYVLGRTLRKAEVTTLIEDKASCASSCAVAFLGGKRRIVGNTGTIIFHAPYASGRNAYGKQVIDCDVPQSDRSTPERR